MCQVCNGRKGVARVVEGNVELEGMSVRLIPMSLDHLEGLFEASKHSENWTYSPGNINQPEDMLNTINHALELSLSGGSNSAGTIMEGFALLRLLFHLLNYRAVLLNLELFGSI
jgi:hypothetical protein